MITPADTPVLLLAGGLGTRVHHLFPDLPKPMIPVAGRPFLEHVIEYFASQGFRRFVLSTGHLADVIETHVRSRPRDGAEITVVRETTPLGTAGGFLFASQRAPRSELLLLANADSLFLADLRPAFELAQRPDVDAVLLGVRVPDASRFGSLRVAEDGTLTAFAEKVGGSGVINAGVYLFARRTLPTSPPSQPYSLEREMLPALLRQGARLHVVVCDAPFVDIGTPESWKEAGPLLGRPSAIRGTR